MPAILRTPIRSLELDRLRLPEIINVFLFRVAAMSKDRALLLAHPEHDVVQLYGQDHASAVQETFDYLVSVL